MEKSRLKSKNVDIASLIVGLIALLISIGHAAIGLFFFLQWPDIQLFAPATVLINYERFGDGECRVRFAAVMAYLNPSRGGHNVLITEERLEYTIDGMTDTYVQKWQKFIRSDSKSIENSSTVEQQDCGKGSNNTRVLDIVDVDIASPFILPAKNSVSHETYFSPSHKNCPEDSDDCNKLGNFVKADVFENLIKGKKGEGNRSITFKFISEIVDHEDAVVSCKLTVDKGVIGWLEIRGWTSARCWTPESSDSQS